MNDEWSGAFELDATSKKPVDEATQQLFQFVQSHEALLDKIDAANCEDLLHRVEESFSKPVQFFSDSVEDKVLPQDFFLIAKKHVVSTAPGAHLAPGGAEGGAGSGEGEGAARGLAFDSGEDHIEGELPVNDALRKSLTVLVYLLDEVAALRDIAERRFYRPLQVFGRPFAEDVSLREDGLAHGGAAQSQYYQYAYQDAPGSAAPSAPGGAPPAPLEDFSTPGVKEKMIGRFLPLLAEMMSFVTRCHAVAVNLVQQLSALCQAPPPAQGRGGGAAGTLSLFQTAPGAGAGGAAQVSPALRALGELLGVLVTLDTLVDENDALRDAWLAYKALVGYARSDPAAFDSDAAAVSAFEAQLVALDVSLLSARCFEMCIEQDFEALSVPQSERERDSERDGERFVAVRSNQRFVESEMLHALKTAIDRSLSLIDTPAESPRERESVLHALCLYALHRRLLPPNRAPDAKLYRSLWAVQKTLPSLCLAERSLLHISEFLTRHCGGTFPGLDVRRLDPLHPETFRRSVYLPAQDNALSQRATLLRAQCSTWNVLVESRAFSFLGHDLALNENGLRTVDAQLELLASLSLRGVALAARAQRLARETLVWHATLQVPLSAQSAREIAALLEALQGVKRVFARKAAVFQEFSAHTTRVLTARLYESVLSVRRKLSAACSVRAPDAQTLSLLQVSLFLEHLLRGGESLSSSAARRAALSLSVDLLLRAPLGTFFKTDKDAARFGTVANTLCALSEVEREIQRVTDCAFMYFHVDLLPFVLQEIYASPIESKRLPYVFAVFADGIHYCTHISHDDHTPYCTHYRAVLLHTLHAYITRPLCVDIENDLRLHTHTKQLEHIQAANPKTENLRTIRPFLELSALSVLGVRLSLSQEVTHYLNRTFYNLTAVALHDWRTYSDMRQLALDKYGLFLMDHFLPMGSLDQGLDVLQIMRNIHVFVSRFAYNMNAQLFVEFRGDANKASKHCNTIQISSIAASLRQHGLGVLNTTVNFTYQFLSSKFRVFSQFLFDDYVKAFLSREHRWFKKHKHSVNNVYPYERALKFVREIRKLGVNDQNKSFLDQFRVLLTEIGNALGYVRMVRSASMRYCAEAVKYLPSTNSSTTNNNNNSTSDGEENVSFEALAGTGRAAEFDEESGVCLQDEVRGAGLPAETVRAARNLDECVHTLVKNFSEGSDYFKVLVSVFQSVLLNGEHDHLKYFYMIVPAMCISWIDASLIAKDAMHKIGRANANMREMYFTDDGFAMGVAYCLAILKQTRKHESLHWEETIAAKMKEDSKNLKEQQEKRAIKEAALAKKREEKARRKSSFFGFGASKKADDDDDDVADAYQEEEEIHTLQTTAKRLESFRRESEQLFYSMSGATIFFKRTDVDT